MKLLLKCAFVVMVCALFIGTSSATGVSMGIKGGLNLAKMWGYDEDEFIPDEFLKMKPGLILGGVCGIKVNKMFTVQPEFLFSVKGIKMKVEESFAGMSYDMTTVINMNYLEIPILFKLSIPLVVVEPNFYVGPALGFRVGISGWAESGGEKKDMPEEAVKEAKESSKPLDFGLAFGGGIDITAGPGSVVIDIRYTLGLLPVEKLTELDKDNGMKESDLGTEKNGALSFMIGYVFNIGG